MEQSRIDNHRTSRQHRVKKKQDKDNKIQHFVFQLTPNRVYQGIHTDGGPMYIFST
jgi:hypothetical protein